MGGSKNGSLSPSPAPPQPATRGCGTKAKQIGKQKTVKKTQRTLSLSHNPLAVPPPLTPPPSPPPTASTESSGMYCAMMARTSVAMAARRRTR